MEKNRDEVPPLPAQPVGYERIADLMTHAAENLRLAERSDVQVEAAFSIAHKLEATARALLSHTAPQAEPSKELQLAQLQAFAGQAGQAHLAQRLDEAVDLAAEAIDLMTRFHSHAKPDDTPDMNAIFPALHFRNFVDDHARLMFKLNQFKRNPVDPAFLRLKKAADEVCAVLGAHGSISARDDRVSNLMDRLYETDPLLTVYADLDAHPSRGEAAEPAAQSAERGATRLADTVIIEQAKKHAQVPLSEQDVAHFLPFWREFANDIIDAALAQQAGREQS